MKASGVKMRTITAIILATIASGVNALDRSGMFVCTPLSSDQKPIIYSFDGEYLIRDNNLKVPFTKVSSLTESMDLYFAFEPTYQGGKKLALQRLLRSDGDLLTSELANFTNHCKSSLELYTLEAYYQDSKRSEKKQLQPILNLIDAVGNLSCLKPKQEIEEFLSPVTEEDFNHIKLTINFDKMWVIEERIKNGGAIESNEKLFGSFQGANALKYQCKSLGIDVPEVDTSEAIVPLASNI